MRSSQFLDDVRVIDLSQFIPGPLATRLLADLGAQVIKIEPPGGDPMRYFMHPEADSLSPIYQHINRGKRICRLDLKSEQGKQTLRQLVADADVLLESFRPGVLERLGFGRDCIADINPGIVHCALSGYGQTGPYRDRAGHDLNYCAASGALGLNGTAQHPLMSFPPIADHAGAMQASHAILAALHAQRRSGEGIYLDLSLFEASLSWQYLPFFSGNQKRAESILNGGAACYNIYTCADGLFVTIAAVETHFWQRFCLALDHPEWINRQYEAMPQESLIAELSRLFASHPRDYWDQLLSSTDCCYETLLMPEEVPAHTQVQARGAMSSAGPIYPGLIDDQPVRINEDIIEFAADEVVDWWNRHSP